MFEKIKVYTKERFPVIPLFLYSFLTLSAIGTFFEEWPQPWVILILSLVYLGFWFHIRILDEFKDYSFDVKYHPERPVSSGEILLDDIKRLGVYNATIIIFLPLIITRSFSLILFLISFGYTFLMYKEFFIENFAERNLTLYIITHEVVFIPLFLYFYSAFNGSLWLPHSVSSVAHFIYLLTPITLMEIGRKIKHRKDTSGKFTTDTYAYRWGQQRTIYIFAALVTLVGVLSFFIESYPLFLSLLTILFGVFIFFAGKYLKTIIVRGSMMITTFITISLLTFLIISNYA